MAIDPSGYDDLSAGELRRRLEEAEETLRAIREGEVDALMVRNPRSEDEVFTLEGDASYYAFMEAMDLGAAAFDEANRLLYANKTLRELLHLPGENIEISHLSAALDEETRLLVANLMRDARDAKKTSEIRVLVGDNELHLLVTAAPLHVGANRGLAVTFTDITAKVRAAAAEASERAAHSIIASANEAVVVCDVDGMVTHANAAVASIYPGNPIGRLFGEVIPLTLPDTTGLLQAGDVIALAIAGTSVQGIEAVAPEAPRVRDLLLSAAPLRVGSDKVSGCVITMVDLSQRKAAEKQQLLLMGELDHRVKNTLALVLSICKRTASTEETVSGFQVAFSGRIQALAATHNLLADRSWSSISIAEVVNADSIPLSAAPRRGCRWRGWRLWSCRALPSRLASSSTNSPPTPSSMARFHKRAAASTSPSARRMTPLISASIGWRAAVPSCSSPASAVSARRSSPAACNIRRTAVLRSNILRKGFAVTSASPRKTSFTADRCPIRIKQRRIRSPRERPDPLLPVHQVRMAFRPLPRRRDRSAGRDAMPDHLRMGKDLAPWRRRALSP